MATPTYISSVGEAGSQQYPNGGTAEVNQYYFWTTQPMPVGDCAFVYITNASSGAVAGMASVDNAGNIYSVLASSYDATDGGSITMFGAPITNSGANKITVSWTGEQEYVSGGVLVESNVTSCGSPDQTWVNSSSSASTSITAGSGTASPSTSGDLMLMCAIGTDGGTSTFTPGSQSIAWKIVPGTPQYTFPSGCQYGTYSSTAAINPAMTAGTSTTYAALAVAIKSGTSGSAAPTNKYVSAIAHWDVSGWTGNNSTTVTEQMAVQGTTLVITGSGYCNSSGAGYYIKAIIDSQSGIWSQVTGSPVFYSGECAASGYAYIWYRNGVTPTSNLTVTITMNSVAVSGDEPDTALTVYDCQNVTAFDTAATATGNQTAAGTLSTASLTPAGANELIIAVESEDYYGVNGASGSFTNFEAGSWINGSSADQCNASYSPPNVPDECNGAEWVTYSGTSAITAQYSSTGIAAAYWAAVIAAFN
ncbi:MAG: hypothetical protein ACLQG3_14460 [Terracidiphilus sp.]